VIATKTPRHVYLERKNILFSDRADRSWYVEATQAIWPQTDRLAAKLEDVTRIMNTLSSDLQKINLLPHRKHMQLPSQFKIDICRTRCASGTA
jgi:hypothetical protein